VCVAFELAAGGGGDGEDRRTFTASPEQADQWGTGGLITEAMIPAMFNEPDKGLWTPAPV
jgi:hypothetical protein